MAKVRYHFDHESLTIKKVKFTFKDYLKKALWYLSISIAFSGLVLLIAYTFFPSPGEKKLAREKEEMNLQFQLMNDQLNDMEAVLRDLENRDDNIYRVIFEADPVPQSIRQAGFGGIDRYDNLSGHDYTDMIIDTRKRLDKISRQLYVQSKSFDEVYKMAKNKEKMLASIPAIVPIQNGTKRIVSGYGYRVHPIYKTLRMHTGIDIASSRGTPVYASGDGVVVNPPGRGRGYGIRVIIDHGYGYKSMYAHLTKKVVKYGEKVKRGQIIGYVGSTGLSVAPHLHYEVIKNNKKVNPVNYFYNDLTPEEYEKVLEVSSRVTQSLS